MNESPPAGCTIISRNYLALARVLSASYAQHHPGARFYLLVVDGLPDGAPPPPASRLLTPAHLALGGFPELAFAYDVAELCTAVKPALLELLLERLGERSVVYLDPDVLVCRPLAELQAALGGGAALVLTPHLLEPLPRDGRRPTDQDILLAGAFNLGLLGLRRGPTARAFLRWWHEQLVDGGARVDVSAGLMTDQRWVDLVPGLFGEAAVLREESYNVAWWNLPQRALARRGDAYLVNGRPLACFHFSGFDPAQPARLTRENQSRTAVAPGSALADLLAHYAALARHAGHDLASAWPCGYSRFDNGVPINVPLRRLYLDLTAEERRRFGDPFQARGADSFLAWATRSDEGGLSPFLRSLYRLRPDVQTSFPDVHGTLEDREGFLRWARSQGARELKFDPKEMRLSETVTSVGV